ncbi:adenylyl-sulfate kinase [Rhodovulum sp. PH10]|uniref:adenylyl-sulfate kinase n=1 Tax=Rhodovulum sp. PH10 TaxID=1187851 RepID=UPI0012FB1AF6|nr:adenylyl-sulfate kinase [Rhodovulum sp. PH10]
MSVVPRVANDSDPDISHVRDRGALRLIACGSVDDGKSTLIGRLLHEAQGVLDDQLAAITRESRRFGTTGEDVDFALLLDGLEAERQQGITIDVAYRFFSTARRAFVVADTPGHAQYTRNMATGASTSELAILLVDARKGLLEQTRRHAAIVALLGIRDVVLAVNKMDLVGWSPERFGEVTAAFRAFAGPLAFRSVIAIPLSARFGDNVAAASPSTPWYGGPTLLDHLETVADEIDIGRGEVLAPPRARPTVTRRFAADLVWMTDHDGLAGGRFLLKTGTTTVPAVITTIADRLDLGTLGRVPADRLGLNAIGRVHVETAVPVAIDSYAENRSTGAFILIDRTTHATAAAGLVIAWLDAARDVHAEASAVAPATRAFVKSQEPLVVWLTGLPGAGKSTIANLVEQRLVKLGHHTMLLDGDNVRQGLNADLGFDVASRAENVRRVAEVARLMTEAGLIVLVALVSPLRADRERAAGLFPPERFMEVLVEASPATCRTRDPKGLYAKAEAGRIANFTGRDQPYEPPLAPALVLPTDEIGPEIAAERLIQAILGRIRQPTASDDASI